MENTCCYPCSDRVEQTRRITVFGKEILAKNYICSLNGAPYQEKPADTKLQLSICPTSFCAAHCKYCMAEDTKKKVRVDLNRLELCLKELKKENIVRGVSFTGGEPFTDVSLLNEIINMVFDILGLQTEVSINTNGTGLSKIHEIQRLSYLESIHISRHHYDDQKNEELFGIRVPTGRELAEIVKTLSYKDLFVFNCLLFRDYIGSRAEAHRFLDFAIEVGVPKVSFITPSPVNDFVKEQKVSYEDVLSKEDERLLMTRSFQDFEFCRCQDGIYVSLDGSLEEFYGRCTQKSGAYYTRGFVYGADNHLRCNFDGEILW